MSVIKTQGKVISAILILFFYYFSNIRIRFHYDAEPITENIEIHEIMKTPAVYISSQLAWFSISVGQFRAITDDGPLSSVLDKNIIYGRRI